MISGSLHQTMKSAVKIVNPVAKILEYRGVFLGHDANAFGFGKSTPRRNGLSPFIDERMLLCIQWFFTLFVSFVSFDSFVFSCLFVVFLFVSFVLSFCLFHLFFLFVCFVFFVFFQFSFTFALRYSALLQRRFEGRGVDSGSVFRAFSSSFHVDARPIGGADRKRSRRTKCFQRQNGGHRNRTHGDAAGRRKKEIRKQNKGQKERKYERKKEKRRGKGIRLRNRRR